MSLKVPKRSAEDIAEGQRRARSRLMDFTARAVWIEEQRRLSEQRRQVEVLRLRVSERCRRDREERCHQQQQEAEKSRGAEMLSEWSENQCHEEMLKAASVLSRTAGLLQVATSHDPSSDAARRQQMPVGYRHQFDQLVTLRDELRQKNDKLRLVPQQCQYLNRVAEEMLSNLAAVPSIVEGQLEQRRLAAENMRTAADVVEGPVEGLVEVPPKKKSESKKRRDRKKNVRNNHN